MKYKINNIENNDSFIIEADFVDELQELAKTGIEKRNWDKNSCFSECLTSR